jgi:hypothetical protein
VNLDNAQGAERRLYLKKPLIPYDDEGAEHRNIRYFALKLIYIEVFCTFIIALSWFSTNIVVLCTFFNPIST